MFARRISSLFRRWFVPAVATFGLLLTSPALSLDNLKILVPAGPGGGWDQHGRALQNAMQSANVVKKITIDNKPGAGGTVGLAQFVTSNKSDPNALLVGGAIMVGAIQINKSPVNLSQVTPIARLTGEYVVIAVSPSSKIQSMKDLVAQLKANPGSVSWGGGSLGGTDQILAAMIAQSSGVDPAKINYIAYPGGGGEVQSATMGGHLTAGLAGYAEFAAQIKSGKLRAVGISSDKRLPGVDIPTLKEQGIDVELINWRAVFGAPGITDAQRKELIDAVGQKVKGNAWNETVNKNQWINMYLAGDEFKAFLDAEQARIAKILESSGVVKK
jgi:putative tricarboxylic transport membrane protein